MKNGCSLCGGKLRNGICTECGMDNRKSDKMYKLNQEDCGSKSLSHVHKEDKVEQYREPVMNKTRETKSVYTQKKPQTQNYTQKSSVNSQKKSFQPSGSYSARKYTTYSGNVNKGKKGLVLAILSIAIIMMIGLIVPLIVSYSEYSGATPEYLGEDFEITPDIQEDWGDFSLEESVEELNPEGDKWEQKIDAGTYIVGVDLPEGIYEILGAEGSSFQISDGKHGRYMSESFGTEEGDISSMTEVPLYSGAIIYIDGMRPVTFITGNGQVQDMEVKQKNPLKETFEITGQAVAGADFPAGTYDIVAEEDKYGVFKYEIPQQGDEAYPLSFSVLMEGSPSEEYPEYCKVYKNVVLPDGALITADEFTVNLVPSPEIVTEDYGTFYDNMY